MSDTECGCDTLYGPQVERIDSLSGEIDKAVISDAEHQSIVQGTRVAVCSRTGVTLSAVFVFLFG